MGSSVMGSVLSSFCSPSLLALPSAQPPTPPPPPPQIKHDVFLSFRGSDTRYTFVSHREDALRDQNIYPFIDDGLNKGDEIASSLFNAIEESQIAIVIFSEDYASSTWLILVASSTAARKTMGWITDMSYDGLNPYQKEEEDGWHGEEYEEEKEEDELNSEEFEEEEEDGWHGEESEEEEEEDGWHSEEVKEEEEEDELHSEEFEEEEDEWHGDESEEEDC